jgi:hypothetical protein
MMTFFQEVLNLHAAYRHAIDPNTLQRSEKSKIRLGAAQE